MHAASVLFERLAARVHQSVRDDAARQGLHALLAALQRHNGHRAVGVCRDCACFLVEGDGYRCGLTNEALAAAQTSKICREWTAPQAA